MKINIGKKKLQVKFIKFWRPLLREMRIPQNFSSDAAIFAAGRPFYLPRQPVLADELVALGLVAQYIVGHGLVAFRKFSRASRGASVDRGVDGRQVFYVHDCSQSSHHGPDRIKLQTHFVLELRTGFRLISYWTRLGLLMRLKSVINSAY